MMLKRILRRLRSLPLQGADSGQAMIMFAILSSALMMTMGVAVEGGRVFVEYRKMQSAADMAALVGAQRLPCQTTDSSCIHLAESDACEYASYNGYAGCTFGGTGAPTANVPPLSCSPYAFIDYGNNVSNPCPSQTGRTSSTPRDYGYIEVQLSKSLNIPIFNKNITLWTHAVARQGTNGRGDYAISILDQTVGSLTMGGSATVNVTGTTFSNGTININGAASSLNACLGGWLVSGNQTAPSQLTTYSTGTPNYSPAGCTGGTADSPTNFEANLPPIDDPYGDSVNPPYQTSMGSWPNCSPCQANGIWLDLGNGQWHNPSSPGSPSGTVELFPGVYNTLALGVGDRAYFNPGVYTFTGGFDPLHGAYCIYGAPACDSSGCATTTFTTGTTAGDQWYYKCSPYGFWDPNTSDPNRPAAVCAACAPTFYNAATGANSTVPLNGVTINLVGNGISQHGNAGGKPGDLDELAAPNPCPGTGTNTSGSAVQFPYGSSNASAQFTYTTSNTDWRHGITTSPANGVVYPSMDFTLVGECQNNLMVWPSELGTGNIQGQHLHFMFFARNNNATPDDTNLDMSLNGDSSENFTGIVYDPKSTLTLNGNGGAGSNGPPWIEGQIVAWDGTFSGNSTVDVVYRPCAPGSTPCGNGPGTALVQ